ncbi:MAG: metal-sensing transcriptional repressor [Deferribacterales bacterium]
MLEDNADIIKRLQRANGHLGKVIEMISEGRGGIDVAQQMQAVTGALSKAKNLYIREQIEHALSGDISSDVLRKELQELSKYL